MFPSASLLLPLLTCIMYGMLHHAVSLPFRSEFLPEEHAILALLLGASNSAM